MSPYRSARTGQMVETTWDKHPPNGVKGRVWRREDKPTARDIEIGSTNVAGTDWRYPWFYWEPSLDGSTVGCGSIARTWREAMDAVLGVYVDHALKHINRTTKGA